MGTLRHCRLKVGFEPDISIFVCTQMTWDSGKMLVLGWRPRQDLRPCIPSKLPGMRCCWSAGPTKRGLAESEGQPSLSGGPE